MKSKTLFFHKGISKNLFMRCWPIWLSYLALLILLFPVMLNNQIHSLRGSEIYLKSNITNWVLDSGCLAAKLSVFVCIIVAMAMFSYLYNVRTCGMINSLPLRRETMFCTAYFTGLIPLLLSDCFTALCVLVLFRTQVAGALVIRWLALVVMSNVAFYGFSVFCAMLTGNLFVLPLVYGVLNMTAMVVEETVRALLGILIYGYTYERLSLSFLSPAFEILTNLNTFSVETGEESYVTLYEISHSSEMALRGYFIAGIVLSVFALLMYRKRRMETAGDTVSMAFLKPLFKYCMAFGTAFVLSSVVSKEFFGEAYRTTVLCVLVIVLLLAGALIGYFGAEMMIQKTMRVFSRKWKGLFITWAVLLALALICELDLTGYEKRVPDFTEVASVKVNGFGDEEEGLEQPENIAGAISLHKAVIEHKKQHESASDTAHLTISYQMKDGSSIGRLYQLDIEGDILEDPESDASRAEELQNSPEAILKRYRRSLEVVPENLSSCTLYVMNRDGDYKAVDITKEEGCDLYRRGILPDMESGSIGWQKYSYDHFPERSNISVGLDLSGRVDGIPRFEYLYYDILTCSSQTVSWLQENMKIEVFPIGEVEND